MVDYVRPQMYGMMRRHGLSCPSEVSLDFRGAQTDADSSNSCANTHP